MKCEVCGKNNKITQPIYGIETCKMCYLKNPVIVVHPDICDEIVLGYGGRVSAMSYKPVKQGD